MLQYLIKKKQEEIRLLNLKLRVDKEMTSKKILLTKKSVKKNITEPLPLIGIFFVGFFGEKTLRSKGGKILSPLLKLPVGYLISDFLSTQKSPNIPEEELN